MATGAQVPGAKSSKTRRLHALGTAVVMLMAGADGVMAQGSDRNLTRPERDVEERRRSGDTVRQSREQQLIRGKDVTFDQVLANPGDLNLAFRYAQTQIRQGDLLGASGTLERILIANPRLTNVRAVYAIVLFRLSNYIEAERELKTVLQQRVTPELRRQLQPFIEAAERRQKTTRWSALASFGYAWDSNRNASATKEDLVRLFGTSAAAGVGAGGAPDNAYQIIARLGVEHDISLQRRHRLVGAVTYFFQDQTNLHFFDTMSLAVQGGAVYDGGEWELQGLGYYRWQTLAQQTLANIFGFRVTFTRPLSRETRLLAFAQIEAQDFSPLREVPIQRLRTGPEYRGGVEVSHLLRPDLQIVGAGIAIRKDATGFFNDYTGVQLLGRITYLFGPGMFVTGQFSWQYDRYDDADPFVSTRRRKDHILRVVGTYGVPLSALLPKSQTVPAPLRGTVFTVTGEIYRAYSNVAAFAYVSYRIGVAVTFRFDF